MCTNKVKILFIVCITSLVTIQCRKEGEPELPPETTKGAGTFGCKVDGRNFVPRSGWGEPGLYVKYYREFSGQNEYWSLAITAGQYKNRPKESIQIGTDSLLLDSGQAYQFGRGRGSPFITYFSELERYQYKPDRVGELFITKHDRDKRILSGRFWFTIYTQPDSFLVRVTEGRFDVRY